LELFLEEVSLIVMSSPHSCCFDFTALGESQNKTFLIGLRYNKHTPLSQEEEK
jgi:hypothetical protein